MPGAKAVPPSSAFHPRLASAGPQTTDEDGLRVVIVSSVRLFREGLAELVARGGWSRSVTMAENIDDADRCLSTSDATIVLVDASEPHVLEMARRLSRAPTVGGVIAFATSDDDDLRLLLAEAGVCGYVSRDGSVADLLAAIDNARRGELECSSRLAAALARRLAQLATGGEADARAERLSYREREIVRLVDEGRSNKEIARTLSIEVATVKNHIHHILHKLGVHRRGEAAAILRRWHAASAPMSPGTPTIQRS